jgi:predicted small metal-binding protein
MVLALPHIEEVEMRKTMDCRKFPGSNCSVTISGEEEEIMPIAFQHAISKHGYPNNDDTKNKLRQALAPE